MSMNVYCIQAVIDGTTCVKVGKAKDPQHRMASLQTGSPVRLELLCVIPCASNAHALRVEAKAHEVLSAHHRHGEWFTLPADWIAIVGNLFRVSVQLERETPPEETPVTDDDSERLLTLEGWAATKFQPPPSTFTLRRWARERLIMPQPMKVGRTYYVSPNARYVPAQEATAKLARKLTLIRR